jgi:RND family efflux transporter MFP subunit
MEPRTGDTDVRSMLKPVAAAFAILGLGVLGACSGHSEDDKAGVEPAAGQTVTVATVRSVDLARTLTVSGTISAWEEVPVGAETGGLVATAVYVDEGSYVRQGQAMVKLNDDVLRAQLAQQDASVKSAEALVAQQDAALDRARELRERGYLSQAGLDTAEANQRTAAAQLEAARAARSETATRLAQTTIRAPVSGRVISRSVTRGQIVQPGTELFRVVRDGRLELDAQVPESDLSLVRSGMTAVVTSDRASGPTGGRVRIVTPEVDPQTRLGVARIALNSGSDLKTGMFARAEIALGQLPALVVPSEAVIYREGQAGVYVVGRDSTVRFVQVRTGAREGPNVAIESGLEAGQRVVVKGAGFLADGDRVTVAPATPVAPTRAPAASAT